METFIVFFLNGISYGLLSGAADRDWRWLFLASLLVGGWLAASRFGAPCCRGTQRAICRGANAVASFVPSSSSAILVRIDGGCLSMLLLPRSLSAAAQPPLTVIV